MNKRLSKLEEKKLRRWVRQILDEDVQRDKTLITEDWDDFWGPSVDGGLFVKTFIAPFTDVFKTAGVAVADMLNVAKVNFDLLFTLSGKKAEKTLQDYKQRRDKIDAQYNEVMKSTNEALGGTDASLILLAMAPGTLIGKGIAATGKTAVDVASSAGWGTLPGISLPDEGTSAQSDKGPILGTLSDLAKIFFVAHHAPAGPLLAEGDEDSEKGEIAAFLEDTGAAAAFTDIAEELTAIKQDQVKNLLPLVEAQGTIIKSLADASTLEEFKAAAAQSAGAVEDIGDIEIQIKNEAQKILKNPKAREDFAKSLLEKEKGSTEKPAAGEEEKVAEISDQVLLPEIEKSVFAQSKTNLQDQLKETQAKLKKNAIEQINDYNLTDPEMKDLESTPTGQVYAQLLRGAVQRINEA
jgi:hypothetical protein